MPLEVQDKIETHVVFILDNSGSMANIAENAKAFFNEQLATLQASTNENMRNFVNLVGFDSSIVVEIRNKDANEVKPLERYRIAGSTALYDAIAEGVKLLDEVTPTSSDVAYLVVIVTDGGENASQEYSIQRDGKSRIQSLIADRRERGNWTFTFMGSEKDTFDVATSLNIPVANVVMFAATAAGVDQASSVQSSSTGRYLESRSRGLVATESFYGGDNQ